jgi:putative Ca2+/H+ antiporter (TMEM165/GDT1 family)
LPEAMRALLAVCLGSLVLAVSIAAVSAETEPKESVPAQLQGVPAVGKKDGMEDKKDSSQTESKVSTMISALLKSVSLLIQMDDKSATRAADIQSKSLTTAEENDRLGIWHAFFASLSVIIVSELGDKTWFIAAIMAMRHSRLTVFFGAMTALALMTVLSGLCGNIFRFTNNFSTMLWMTRILCDSNVF